MYYAFYWDIEWHTAKHDISGRPRAHQPFLGQGWWAVLQVELGACMLQVGRAWCLCAGRAVCLRWTWAPGRARCPRWWTAAALPASFLVICEERNNRNTNHLFSHKTQIKIKLIIKNRSCCCCSMNCILKYLFCGVHLQYTAKDWSHLGLWLLQAGARVGRLAMTWRHNHS